MKIRMKLTGEDLDVSESEASRLIAAGLAEVPGPEPDPEPAKPKAAPKRRKPTAGK